MSEPILCYVDAPWAYFTTQPLERQWGDDWDDAPYEHNAEPPYEWHEWRESTPWQIVRVAYDANLRAPCDGQLNSPYSVEQINERAVPWLSEYDDSGIRIWAGMSLSEFLRLIWEVGGKVYVEQAQPAAVREHLDREGRES